VMQHGTLVAHVRKIIKFLQSCNLEA
jgi:hypothetical protein